ncbi:MAG: hypothetical protein FVQ81_15940 [Candidatus Glassbacteria bacterium]|nr:hypothetical protein [Candidatus Glassbacteria bacterium]
MYMGPGGSFTQSFGDGAENIRPEGMRQLMETAGLILGRGDWRYLAHSIPAYRGDNWIDVVPGERRPPNWFQVSPGVVRPQTFIRRALRGKVPVEPPAGGLPPSKIFRGTGQAALNTDMADGSRNVQVQFRSSPLGTISHMHCDQNGFLISAFGSRLAIHAGFRPWYGSEYCKNYYWTSKAQNTILVDGEGQVNRSLDAVGRITGYAFGDSIDIIVGEASEAYGGRLDLYRRAIVFVKPDLVVVADHLIAPRPREYTWQLHTPSPLTEAGGGSYTTVNGEAAMRVTFIEPAGLRISLTSGDPVEPELPAPYEPQWHLAATTERANEARIVSLLQIGQGSAPERAEAALEGGVLTLSAAGRSVSVTGLFDNISVSLTGDNWSETLALGSDK